MRSLSILMTLSTVAVADVVITMPPPPVDGPPPAIGPDHATDHDGTVSPLAASSPALENFAQGEPAKDRSGAILAQVGLSPNGGGAMYFNGTYGPGYWGWPYWGWYGYWGGYTWCPPQPCPPTPSPGPWGVGQSCSVGFGARPVWNSVSIGF